MTVNVIFNDRPIDSCMPDSQQYLRPSDQNLGYPCFSVLLNRASDFKNGWSLEITWTVP